MMNTDIIEEVLVSMGQSSNYKQYNRTTRILTEETGFSGGMMWTGNNIDASHLKSIVNCDYDDTTGFLKTRDPFLVTSSTPADFLYNDQTNIDLRNYDLIGVYNTCAFDETDNDELTAAGVLYVFGHHSRNGNCWYTPFNSNTVVIIYRDANAVYHLCELDLASGVELHSTNRKQTLTQYENVFYGFGKDQLQPNAWIHVYKLVRTTDENFNPIYKFKQDSYETVDERINGVALAEASITGFNAARGEETFRYSGELIDAGTEPRILGLYLTDKDGNVITSPTLGQDAYINVTVSYQESWDDETAVVALFYLKDGGGIGTTSVEEAWQHHAHLLKKDAHGGIYTFPFQFKNKNTTIGVAYYGAAIFGAIQDNVTKVYSTQTVDTLLPYSITASKHSDNVKLKEYDLSSATSHCVWNNRMCLWGTTTNDNCLFLSEIDNFYYYPVPHNVAVFDTNVISCIPYKDTLLVFTADKIYRVAVENDGTFTQTVVQNDMPLSNEDSAHLTAIKNMVLFKSNNYFYMIVPKAQSLTDELSIAPIYKNIAGFLNTLDKSMLEVLQLLYPEYRFDSLTIKHNAPTDVYAQQDTVHILYDVNTSVRYTESVETSDSIQTKHCTFKIFLNYNTNLRAWTLYIIDTTNISFEVAMLTSARRMSFVRIPDNKHFEVVTQSYSDKLEDGFRVLLDTGYRTLSTTMQKRFREIQIKLYSESENLTAFGTAFLVDGVWRRNYAKLQETTLSNNQVSLMPSLDLNTFITELSMPVNAFGEIEKSPGSDSIELTDWTLDFSHFKREAPVTVRVPVSGKGYNPRFIFMTPNAINITINEINWVYRMMYGR